MKSMRLIAMNGDVAILRGLMLQKNIKATELAAKTGLSYSTIEKIARGALKPSPFVRDRIEQYFGCEIFAQKQKRKPKTTNK